MNSTLKMWGLRTWNNRQNIDLHFPRRKGYEGPPIDASAQVLFAAKINSYNSTTGVYTCRLQVISSSNTFTDGSGTLLAKDPLMLAGYYTAAHRRLADDTYVMLGKTASNNTYLLILEPWQEIFYGAFSADWTGSTNPSLTPCDQAGTATGMGTVAPSVFNNLDITSYDAGGGSTTTNAKFESGKIVPWTIDNANGLWILTPLSVAIVMEQYNPSNHKLEAKVQWSLGNTLSTISDWLPVREFVAADIAVITGGPDGNGCYTVDKKTAYFPEAPA